MRTVIVAHRDPHKAGATEHVDAIVQSLRSKGIQHPLGAVAVVENRYGADKAEPVDLTDQLVEIRREHGDVRYIAVTGDYGCDHSKTDESVAETLKRMLSDNNPWGTQVVLSSYTAENSSINRTFEKGVIDFLAVPEYAVDPLVLGNTPAAEIMQRARDRLIPMTAVPHLLNQASLDRKSEEWQTASQQNKVAPLPEPDPMRPLVMVIIPGDVEDGDGRPKLFTQEDAIALADAVAKTSEHSPLPMYLLSNGPRTSKYKPELLDIPGTNFNNPASHNAARMDGVESNSVTKAFLDRLSTHVGSDNIISGCIAKGRVPPQGFLAFYKALNHHAVLGGEASLYVDGVSTTMMAQAANVLDSRVSVIACDTPAKNRTHDAGLNFLFAKGHVDCLRQTGAGYDLDRSPIRRSEVTPFDDAAIIQNKIRQIAESQTVLDWIKRLTNIASAENADFV